MNTHQDPFIGARLGSYDIIEAIGEGGMARIYKGYHAELNRYTAIKVINWGLQEDPEYTERFRREAQAIAILRHPNIVQIFDFGKHSSGYFMVMEFIDGTDLAALLRDYREQQNLLPPAQIIHLVKDVAAALDYTHSRGVVHRDIKPSNVMLTQEGQAILTDFGLVMLPAFRSQHTLGNTFGTPHYIAPEQAISSAAASPASDIYALGVILYEMTAGQLPFDDESPLSVALKHVSDAPPPPLSFNPNLPPPVEAVILRALAKEPTDRFATAGDLATALEMAWSGIYTIAATPILPAGMPPAAIVSKMTLPGPAAADPSASTSQLLSALQPSDAPKQKKSIPWWPVAIGAIGLGLMGVWLFFSFFNDTSAQPAVTSTLAVVNLITTTSTLAPLPTATSTALPATLTPPTHTPTPSPLPSPILVPMVDSPTSSPTTTSTSTSLPTSTPTLSPTATLAPSPTPTSTVNPASPLTREQLTGKILFKTDRAGYVQIYRMDADGANQLPFDDPALYAQLQVELPLSASKQEQILVRGEGQLDLWRVNLVTKQELRVTSTGRPEYDPAWSPVDNRLVYVSEETGNGDIYLLNLDGSAIERLTFNTDNFDKHPTWSPDGRQVAFWSDISFNKTRQIYVINLDTRIISSLSDNPFNDWDPVWVH
jgi:serine/threonine-protein kinase